MHSLTTARGVPERQPGQVQETAALQTRLPAEAVGGKPGTERNSEDTGQDVSSGTYPGGVWAGVDELFLGAWSMTNKILCKHVKFGLYAPFTSNPCGKWFALVHDSKLFHSEEVKAVPEQVSRSLALKHYLRATELITKNGE